MTPLHPLDWLVLALYVVLALVVGVLFSRRASKSVDEYFLSGRTLPWWVVGTSMVATTFAADTPLLITGWVRDSGVWKNWVWWCIAVNTALQVFLFSRWWRRGGLMTKAELAELRYGGREASVLRASLGILHSTLTNTMVLCWVLLAAAKISDVVFGVDQTLGLAVSCAIALCYSLMAGFWGVVMTDLLQFVMAMGGAAALAWISWHAVGGWSGVEAAAAGGTFSLDVTHLFPHSLPGASLWTVPIVSVAVYLGVNWWAAENVDGSATVVQRVCAARDPRQGMLGVLWYSVAHYALRPWLWISVAVASLVFFPTVSVKAPVDGTVVAVDADAVRIAPADAGPEVRVPLPSTGDAEQYGWRVIVPASIAAGKPVEAGKVVASTDSERAYLAMMRRFLPVGLLGLVAASLLAAFMSTIDTHVNLAASYFVNDVYRRFLHRNASDRHYVNVGRIASLCVLLVGALFAARADSVRKLFLFFLSLTAGVGPVYVLRWTWWRVRASTEITAMVTSAVTSVVITFGHIDWSGLGPFFDPAAAGGTGDITDAGRIVLVVLLSTGAAAVALLLAPRPDPETLVPFYRRVRPIGLWGPVRALAPDVRPPRELAVALLGTVGALGVTFGPLLWIGALLLARGELLAFAIAASVAGAGLCAWALARLEGRARGEEPA